MEPKPTTDTGEWSSAESPIVDRDLRPVLGELAANGLPGLSFALALYYAILGFFHPSLVEGPARTPMTTLAFGGAAALTAICIWSRSRTLSGSDGHLGQAMISVVVLANCLAHLALTGDALQSTNLALAIIGGGLLIYHPYLYTGLLAVATAGWVSTLGSAGATGLTSHFAFMIVGSVFISVMAYRSRIRTLLSLESVQERLRSERHRRRLEDRARESQKFESLGRMAGGIAHDFNNLLTIVSGNAELWLSGSEPDSRGRYHAREVLEASGRAAELTQQILTYSGRARSDKRPTDLAAEIERMRPLLRSIVGPRIELLLTLEPDLEPVNCDVDQIRQVVANLVSNSAQAIGDGGGKVTVRLYSTRDGAVRLAVEDTGCGIAADHLPKIFDPFFSTKGAGRGLGLSVVHGILQNHGASVRASSGPGRGARISAIFPAHPRSAEAAVRAGDVSYTPGTPRLALVIEDEPGVRALASQVLRKAGFQTIEAGDSRSALELARERVSAISLLLLDLTLPDEDGFAALRRLRECGCIAPVILMSGYSRADVQPRAEDVGVRGFLQKPFRAAALVEAAERCVANAE